MSKTRIYNLRTIALCCELGNNHVQLHTVHNPLLALQPIPRGELVKAPCSLVPNLFQYITQTLLMLFCQSDYSCSVQSCDNPFFVSE